MSTTELRRGAPIAMLDPDGRIALPAEFRQLAGLEAGDAFEVVLVADGILLRPRPDEEDEMPEAFWGPNWRQEVDDDLTDIAEGRGVYYDSDEEFLASLA